MKDERVKEDLYNAFDNADTILLKKYVGTLGGLPMIEAGEAITKIRTGSNACLYHVDKIVYDKDENIHDKLMTVYTSLLSDEKNSLVMILKGCKTHVDLYLGAAVRNVNEEGGIPDKSIDNAGKTLVNVLRGNFPGSQLHRVDKERRKDKKGKFISDSVESVIEDCFKGVKTIASVSGIAALRNQNEHASEKFVQGMEKLADSMRGKEYAAIYIADVMGTSVIDRLCGEYEDIYSQLSPFKQSVHILNENNSKTDTNSMIEGVVNTTNESLAKSVTHGTTHAVTKTNTFGGSVSVNVGKDVGVVKIGGGLSADYHHSRSTTEGENESFGDTTTEGKARSLSTQNSIANAITSGSGESLQITYDNRAVKTLLDRIDEQIKRLRSCEDFGLFDSCVYFISGQYEDAVSAASAYRSLIRGEDSSAEAAAVNIWTKDKEGTSIDWLSQYLKRFYHPMFALQTVCAAKPEDDLYLPVTPALMASGKELAFQFSLPKKSLSGLPVLECAEFGRNVMGIDGKCQGDLRIGKVYHMHQAEEEEVMLSAKSMTAHTFVTGSTGAGKSNAIYQILTEAVKRPGTSFMVVEPAKGEYKDVFGMREDIKVSVYGTNPQMTPLLRINPFRFPETTHVYEHMDRLVEVFNVCWPMYAAMPAVLKAALENAYTAVGWDLRKSINETGAALFPTFSTVAEEVRKYIDSSEYSDENKGNYKGALVTRLESLTNGVNGMIFCADDLSDEELFDNNVIVDLSRIGSMETKALLMGILVMRLQEHRMGTSAKNSRMKHITVLEEAHNLLKRTSAEQSMEGANLLGKSVEMLSNSIAEMRTYGEAFIIADQAPGLLDMSAIRNTNTKIVFRLPDYSDRELVGKAANLNDGQIAELARLKTGVAAVYQNNWVSPVLCQFDEYMTGEKVYVQPDRHDIGHIATSEVLDIIMKADVREKLDDVDYREKIVRDITVSAMPDWLKVKILKYLKAKDRKVKELSEIAYRFFEAEDALNSCPEAENIADWIDTVTERLKPSVKDFTEEEIDRLLALLVTEHYANHEAYEPVYLSVMEHVGGKKKLM